ncbi:hypothetical protein PIIN_11276 [Serendipita indica DSM 11827]|uniref:Uncharacterized protein n=1 Tax=Serendipita indica (strain DSM 11827) TaxID=1109443 RepID=G4U156_SERID|nr:hypothetical protein PIIN_11276 [Serendipita indica DSM 11827]
MSSRNTASSRRTKQCYFCISTLTEAVFLTLPTVFTHSTIGKSIAPPPITGTLIAQAEAQ